MPEIHWTPSPNFWTGRQGMRPLAVVCHIEDGTEAGTVAWFQNPESRVSTHYSVAKDGTIHHYVREEDAAWGNGVVRAPSWALIDAHPDVNPNLFTLSVEHEGKPGDEMPQAQYASSLWLVSGLCARWDIRPDTDHIVGHYRIDGISRAHCPGPTFPWERLLADLRA
jgi:N-acetyl-anhydromuramyl-L-alanine amidase AmpD